MKLEINKIIKSKDFKKFILFSLVIFVAFFVGLNMRSFNKLKLSDKLLEGQEVSAAALNKALADKDFLLVNVHTPYEGEIPNTDMFIEYNFLSANKDKLPEDKNTAIILYCQSGRMSKEALLTLKGMGYTNVKHLAGGMVAWEKEGYKKLDLSNLSSDVLPEEGFEIPVSWGDLGRKMVEIGVIDLDKFEEVVDLTDSQKEILAGKDEKITINAQNSRFVVNMLWAAGLAQRSKVYDEGPMGKEYKADIGNFASTGGWTLAQAGAVNYLGKHDLVSLTQEDQERVVTIAKNVYRPCCGNNTWFPDCNHGMAALFAIELMVSQGVSDEEIYKNLLKLSSYWFPSTYLQIATLFARQEVEWDSVDAKLVLGESYSSARGASEVAEGVGPLPYDTKGVGGSCGA